MTSPGAPRWVPARAGTVVLVALVVCGLGWVVLRGMRDSGADPLPMPWTAVAGTGVLVFAVLVAGLPMRRWQREQRRAAANPSVVAPPRRPDALQAARLVVLAKAAAYGGGALGGWYAAQALAVLPDLVGQRRERFLLGVAAAVAAGLLAGAGLLVQSWCRVPPDDPDEVDPRD